MTKKKISIIGGQWRGRKLFVPNSIGLHPTTHRIREMLFNWLRSDIYQAKCLDCFSGSGSLGFEALSRNASSVTLLEIQQTVVRQLLKNREILGANSGHIVHTNSLHYISKKGTPYHIVFIDPPFHHNLIIKTITLLEKNSWLENESLIYIESEINKIELAVPKNWKLYRQKTTGQVESLLYQRLQNK
ncbi:16S rRNA (guanine(966)-N(2))-methyltransferase RsmD [Candidatus Erwinia haradaeae]|uniref:Ribosomal RNA small subunit methyltransferase D n=1 Tax=Candidatus Erwinia haradaeae TaxID=1922217 RepID=A0A803FT01_9GAMM|nr:16S rRNA (guanine(966)-N(2))-methyltransferase RsmD [Candidatus Erwinia haradaeae]VFP87477.1 Ribosomal RNA small subunit methyltransferase D [Candidatus Erwinia haradaeae]